MDKSLDSYKLPKLAKGEREILNDKQIKLVKTNK